MQERRQDKDNDNKTILKLEFVSESVSNKIRNRMKANNLPIKVAFTPNQKLRYSLCSNGMDDKIV